MGSLYTAPVYLGSVTDVVTARAAIRKVVEPLKLKCSSYQVKEQLGRASGKDWLDDDFRVVVKATISPDEGFPCRQYENNRWELGGLGLTRETAMKAFQDGVEGMVPEWEKLLADDVELAARVGGRCRSVKATSYYLTDQVKRAFDAGEDVNQAIAASTMKLPVGTELKVVAHEPGKIRLRACWGDEWWVYRWEFYSYLTTNKPGERIPDPHYEFLEGD